MQNKLEGLTNEELLLKARKTKSSKVYDAAIFGVLFGISLFSTIKMVLVC